MEIRRFRLFLILSFLFSALLPLSGKALAQSDSARVVARDSITYGWEQIAAGWKWVSKHVGGDLFLSYEIYGLHLSGIGSLTRGYGPGAELRISPLFIGGIVGICGDEGISPIHELYVQRAHQFGGYYFFSSLYAGIIVSNCRMEIGGVYGDSRDWVSRGPGENYTAGFFGVSKRWGDLLFVEPEAKIMFPIVAHYAVTPDGESWWYFSEKYHLRDLFFAISLKAGIGVN